MHSTSGNFEDDVDESVETNCEQVTQEKDVVAYRDNMDQTTPVTFQSKKFKKSQKETIITPFQNKLLLSCLEKSLNTDPDTHFLLSLLPDYKKLNDTQKLEFRINTLQFFKNINSTDS